MAEALEVVGVGEPLITERWLEGFREQVRGVGRSRLDSELEADRFAALGVMFVIVAHHLLAEPRSSFVQAALAGFHDTMRDRYEEQESHPLTLAQLVTVFDMASAACTLLENRRHAVGDTESDIPTQAFSDALLRAVRRFSTDAQGTGIDSMLRLLRPFRIGCATLPA